MSSPSSKPTISYPDWQPQLLDAMGENDPERLREKVAAAEDAIFLRWQNMDGDRSGERAAMDEACRIIKQILVEKLGYPDGKS